MPVADSIDVMNARFLDQCMVHRQAVLRGRSQTIGERMQADLATFMPLPAVPFDPCHIVLGRASSMSLVRYRTNDYSVPTAYAHQEVVNKGGACPVLRHGVDRVAVICRGEQIAVHWRSYEREDFIANPLHYLALLEQKPRALDQAAPLDSWVLAEPMHRIRRLMEARSGPTGRKWGRSARVYPGAAVVRAVRAAPRGTGGGAGAGDGGDQRAVKSMQTA